VCVWVCVCVWVWVCVCQVARTPHIVHNKTRLHLGMRIPPRVQTGLEQRHTASSDRFESTHSAHAVCRPPLMAKSDVQLLASGPAWPGQRTNVGDCEGDCVGDCEGVDVVGVAVGAGVGGGGDDEDLPLTGLTTVCSSSTSRLPHRCSGSCLPSPLRAGAATTAPTHVTAAATRTMGSETTLIRQSVILGSGKKPKCTSWCRRRLYLASARAVRLSCVAWCHVR